MKLFGPLARAVAFAGLVVVGVLEAAPSVAGPAEVAMLESYVGSWQGSGQLTGARSDTVVCKLTISPGNGDKVNYSGRCAIAGTTASMRGTLAYIDAARRFEAAMTTNAGFSGVAVGQRGGGGVVFNMRDRAADEEGNDLSFTAGITLTEAKITANFSVVFLSSGDTIKAVVPFSK